MKFMEYRIEQLPRLKVYVVRCTWGLLDTMLLYAGRQYKTLAEAKAAAKQHAQEVSVTPSY